MCGQSGSQGNNVILELRELWAQYVPNFGRSQYFQIKGWVFIGWGMQVSFK